MLCSSWCIAECVLTRNTSKRYRFRHDTSAKRRPCMDAASLLVPSVTAMTSEIPCMHSLWLREHLEPSFYVSVRLTLC